MIAVVVPVQAAIVPIAVGIAIAVRVVGIPVVAPIEVPSVESTCQASAAWFSDKQVRVTWRYPRTAGACHERM